MDSTQETTDELKVVVMGQDQTSRRIRMMIKAAEASGIHVLVVTAGTGYYGQSLKNVFFDDLKEPAKLAPWKDDPKRRALLAQLERAKLQRNKNLVRDLTRQLQIYVMG